MSAHQSLISRRQLGKILVGGLAAGITGCSRIVRAEGEFFPDRIDQRIFILATNYNSGQAYTILPNYGPEAVSSRDYIFYAWMGMMEQLRWAGMDSLLDANRDSYPELFADFDGDWDSLHGGMAGVLYEYWRREPGGREPEGGRSEIGEPPLYSDDNDFFCLRNPWACSILPPWPLPTA